MKAFLILYFSFFPLAKSSFNTFFFNNENSIKALEKRDINETEINPKNSTSEIIAPILKIDQITIHTESPSNQIESSKATSVMENGGESISQIKLKLLSTDSKFIRKIVGPFNNEFYVFLFYLLTINNSA